MPLDPSRVPLTDRVAAVTGAAVALALVAAGCGLVAPPPIPPLQTPEPPAPLPPPIEAPLVVRSVLFAPGSAEIDAASAVALDVAAAPLRDRPDLRVAIEGHTDSLGADAENQTLSLERALAVRRYLVRKGVPPERLSVRGVGASDPVASNATPDGRARNRRVELEVQ